MIELDEIKSIVNKALEIFQSFESPFLGTIEVDGNVAFVGDTHGAIDVTSQVFSDIADKVDKVVFLGDYVDRGEDQLGNLKLILQKLIENKEKYIVLRGNHESPLTNEYYGFKKEISNKLGEENYNMFIELFSYMPYAVVVNNYFCVHGGIASGLEKVEDIKKLPRPDEIPNDPIAFQLLWNDPREGLGDLDFLPNIRGEGTYYFGERVVEDFLKKNSLNGIIRGHEVADGFREDMNGKVITVFSSRYHKMRAGVLILKKDGKMDKIYL
ncbi:serine/threonine protein phosphatase [Sulfolobus sp. A20-N-F6]|nr:serine/threonine protein phosphatase [Sulfolobus sp. A20-N-F8]TRM81533.1 serine/threonine protein phosphatase [Sulfolobus sp. D5]TRM83779.1 serine/threonine protein phosphatase [Sulfolobus sp. A20-N-F6]TRM88948.1 serine/threonine protein phosphatase [Sulfolobus sp. C3]TRM92140.1 serine/threonine protein phosphatase [Sulfolobus sp. A20-N-G8]TRM98978.1 serine/threonine protein phosphatase [Sulfolobus sp. E1]